MKTLTRLMVAALHALSLLLPGLPTHASPGAHGPNGEHLDAPAQGPSGSAGAPRFEARTETFEMVGRLQGGELSILVNRFETNEPVLEASVELEAGDVKAKAPFHSDLGDYAVDDKAFLDAIGKPGRHSLVIMVVAGQDSDLLEATLHVAAGAAQVSPDREHPWWETRGALYGALGLTGLIAVTALFMRRRRSTAALQEGTR